MALELDLTALQGNDEVYNFGISYGISQLDLTGLTLTFYLKANRFTADLLAWTTTPSIIDAKLGEFSVSIPRTELTTNGALWYRVDALNGSSFINTLVYGVLTVLAV